LLDGNSVKALEQFENLYNYNVDVSTLLRELLDVNYNIILSKILTNFFEVTKLPSDQVEIIKNTSQKLQISSLMRVWKMLLKGEYELKSDFDSKKIMEILLLNICYGSRLPSLNDIINGESKEDNNEKVFSEIMDMFEGSKQV
ncbi:MAG: hypothetical protein LBC92_01320, partial [Rickettsiales bacterium]|nr:hypothetical protein [Rickettsiales bacterium]